MEEKAKRFEAELELPGALIQHIQSFLNAKEAARTSLLSRSWHGAWLTRPNLDFRQQDFRGRHFLYDTRSQKRFWNFVNKTVERYDKLNLKIDSLRLWICTSCFAKHNSADDEEDNLFNKLIKKALKMGATCLELKNDSTVKVFSLTREVFGTEGKVNCSKLKSLTLGCVYVKVGFIRYIISNCPLMESFSLSPSLWSGKINMGSLADYPISKLKCLLLSRVEVDFLFFDDFSNKFPCVKDLSLHDCVSYEGINISSPSLEHISFEMDTILLMAKLDVPNIRKFTFSGSAIPSLSFKTTTSSWESDILIRFYHYPTNNWILNLNKLLTKLSLSKVSLTLSFLLCRSGGRFYHTEVLPKPKVENLTIDMHESDCSYLFHGLFQCCRPIYIKKYWIPGFGPIQNYRFMKLVYKTVMRQVSLKGPSANQSMPGESYHLVGVDVEFFDETVSVWRPRLLDASTNPGDDEQIIRLHLRWEL